MWTMNRRGKARNGQARCESALLPLAAYGDRGYEHNQDGQLVEDGQLFARLVAQRHFNHVASMRGLVHGLRLRLDRNKSACFDFDGAITGTFRHGWKTRIGQDDNNNNNKDLWGLASTGRGREMGGAGANSQVLGEFQGT